MTGDLLFVGIFTADLSTSVAWYEALFGRPADVIVSKVEVMWQVRDRGWLYILEDRAGPGRALVSISVANLDASIREIVARGIAAPAVETVPGAGRKAPFVDPEGNIVTLLELSATSG